MKRRCHVDIKIYSSQLPSSKCKLFESQRVIWSDSECKQNALSSLQEINVCQLRTRFQRIVQAQISGSYQIGWRTIKQFKIGSPYLVDFTRRVKGVEERLELEKTRRAGLKTQIVRVNIYFSRSHYTRTSSTFQDFQGKWNGPASTQYKGDTICWEINSRNSMQREPDKCCNTPSETWACIKNKGMQVGLRLSLKKYRARKL